jgi:septal ring factor EnvC (AmiA/AmiB activator)
VTNTEKIRELELNLATLNERVSNLREDLKRHEGMTDEIKKLLRGLENTSSSMDHRLSEAEKKLSESSSRRWEIFRLVLAAVLGSALTLGASQLNRWLNYQQPNVKQLEPAQPAVQPRG